MKAIPRAAQPEPQPMKGDPQVNVACGGRWVLLRQEQCRRPTLGDQIRANCNAGDVEGKDIVTVGNPATYIERLVFGNHLSEKKSAENGYEKLLHVSSAT